MNTSRQQSRLNFAEHGTNCLDPRCVLPVCVNLKLSTGHANSPKKDRQNCHRSEDARRRGVNRQRGESILGHDAEEQLMKDLEDFERVFQNQKVEFQSSFMESLGIKDWTNVGSQQVPHVTDYNPIPDMEVEPTSWFPTNAKQTYEEGFAFKLPPDKSISDFTKDRLPSHLEQFIPMNSYVVPLEKKEDKEAKCTQNDHKESASEFLPGFNTDNSLEDGKERLSGFQSKDTNKLFGILSEILHMFETPMSAELEAFYVQILQRALKEIQNAGSLNGFPDDMHVGRFREVDVISLLTEERETSF